VIGQVSRDAVLDVLVRGAGAGADRSAGPGGAAGAKTERDR
jgi:hypothetical protein